MKIFKTLNSLLIAFAFVFVVACSSGGTKESTETTESAATEEMAEATETVAEELPAEVDSTMMEMDTTAVDAIEETTQN